MSDSLTEMEAKMISGEHLISQLKQEVQILRDLQPNSNSNEVHLTTEVVLLIKRWTMNLYLCTLEKDCLVLIIQTNLHWGLATKVQSFGVNINDVTQFFFIFDSFLLWITHHNALVTLSLPFRFVQLTQNNNAFNL